MKTFLTCLFQGHDYELLSHKSFGPKITAINLKADDINSIPFSLHSQMIGYTKTVQICKRCGKVNITQSLGE
jgi:hypothetical protein